MRVTFINRFYWPAEPATAQLLQDLAEMLATRGWDVSVITGHAVPGSAREETRHGVRIVRIGRPMAVTQNLVRRGWDFALFHLAVMPALWRRLRAGDVVVPLTDPPLIGVTTNLIARGRRGQTMHWVHDIYPEVVQAVQPGFAAALLHRVVRPFRNAAWRRARACVVLGEDMAATVRAAGVPRHLIHIVPNWAPRGVEPAGGSAIQQLREKWGVAGRFVVGYSGNLGRVHDLGGLLAVASDLAADPRFVFLFIGRGAAFATLRRAAAEAGLANVRFLPPQSRRELAVSLGVPDVHLISVRPGCEALVFPSKLYGAAAVQRPVILLGAADSELAGIIRARGMGATFAPGDSAEIAAYLRELAADPGRRERQASAAAEFHRANGGIARAAQQWETLLGQTARPAAASAPARGPRH